MSTNKLSAKNIKRETHVIDASGKILGRLATEAATILMGKKKPEFVPYLDTGDFVVVTNASKIKVTGKKAKDKVYTSHSGYPGGLRQETFDKIISRKPEYVIEHAIKGMLPHNRLGSKMVKKLKVFAGEAK
ncbi:50S ribosomal protein L13 [Candidatus Daviesbacteria bacterium]|nr:50S ribosomal protein L13 [Candidatus Daviesbacteria bacterium]